MEKMLWMKILAMVVPMSVFLGLLIADDLHLKSPHSEED